MGGTYSTAEEQETIARELERIRSASEGAATFRQSQHMQLDPETAAEAADKKIWWLVSSGRLVCTRNARSGSPHKMHDGERHHRCEHRIAEEMGVAYDTGGGAPASCRDPQTRRSGKKPAQNPGRCKSNHGVTGRHAEARSRGRVFEKRPPNILAPGRIGPQPTNEHL